MSNTARRQMLLSADGDILLYDAAQYVIDDFENHADAYHKWLIKKHGRRCGTAQSLFQNILTPDMEAER